MGFLRILSGGQLLFFLLSCIATASVAASFFLSDELTVHVIVAVLVSLTLFLAARQFLHPIAYRMRTIRYAIWLFTGLFIATASLQSVSERYLIALIRTIDPDFTLAPGLSGAPTALVLFLIVTMYAVTLLCLRDGTSVIPAPPDPLMKVASYRDLRNTLINNLEFDLARVDEELRWNHADFISLDAEVDVRNVGIRRKRVVDLVTALKNNQDSDLFLVVGVPGAGKSVALRKCCRELLEAKLPGERIPIYVNLKEWVPKETWTATSGPTNESFAAFVRRNIKNRLPNNMLEFFEEHFDRMLAAGEIFFIFDSFDEIPGILDVDETSHLLKLTSDVVVRYLKGSANGRGIIASRYYRRPRLGQIAHVQLDIRPFSDRQIASVIRTGPNPEGLLRVMYQERLELGALARNPFSLSLLMDYWRKNGLTAPQTQSELYSSYIDQSLKDAAEHMAEYGLDAAAVRQAMEDISWEMFSSAGRGLEMTMRELRAATSNPRIDEIVDVLIAARLARKAARTQAVSFVHRRFNEYFIVTRWLGGTAEAPLESIPNDGRSRDAMVLYAEVTGDQEARRIAEYCWAEISDGLQASETSAAIELRVVYCLRYLVEAFRARQSALIGFREELSEKVIEITATSKDIMLSKIAVESVGLLPEKAAERTLVHALSGGNKWIAETAISSCRYLTKIPEAVTERLYRTLSDTGPTSAMFPDRDLGFALSLSDIFRELRARLRARQADWWLASLAGFVALTTASVLSSPVIGLLCLVFGILLFLLFDFLRPHVPYKATRQSKSAFAKRMVQAMRSKFFIRTDNFAPDVTLIGLSLTPIISFNIWSLIITNDFISFEFNNAISSSNYEQIYVIIILICFVLQMKLGTVFHILGKHGVGHLMQILKKTVVDFFSDIPFLFLIGYLSFMATLYLFILIFEEYLEQIIPYLAVIIALLIIVYLLVKGVRSYRDHVEETRSFKNVTAKFVPNRLQIASDFNRFKSERFRLRYAQWVDRESTDPEHTVALSKHNWVSNPWPDGQRPNVDNDAGSTLLARVDGRWLGLEV
jgi:hypothetical protein